jgi:hypothetical protein
MPSLTIVRNSIICKDAADLRVGLPENITFMA